MDFLQQPLGSPVKLPLFELDFRYVLRTGHSWNNWGANRNLKHFIFIFSQNVQPIQQFLSYRPKHDAIYLLGADDDCTKYIRSRVPQDLQDLWHFSRNFGLMKDRIQGDINAITYNRNK